jgi:hypothetical protein
MMSAADAVRALSACGFEDDDIELFGVLSGKADLTRPLLTLGVPVNEIDYYSTWFEHGAVLVIVRTSPYSRRNVASKLLRQCGGTLAAESLD